MNKLGFGFLRLPTIENNKKIDYTLLCQMVDEFIKAGGIYFDTAYTYLDGLSEEAIKEAVVKRYSRDKIQIANKLPSWKIKSYDECIKYFNEQLNRCGVTYFDTYLLHWLNKSHYDIATKYEEFTFLEKLKSDGKVKKIGFSYHDNAQLLDKILSQHPEIDVVQLQINYLDWDSEGVQSKLCYEVAVKHNKEVIVMEPVKGGTLASLSPEAESIFTKFNPSESIASWAIKFAQSLDNVSIVLSGMNSLEQLNDNMRQVDKLGEDELSVIWKVRDSILSKKDIPCTGCGYCFSDCPKNIAIPQYFKLYNEHLRNPDEDWKVDGVYELLNKEHGKASHCISCKLCESNCPQKINITKELEKIAAHFED